jgi:hypothetical protein
MMTRIIEATNDNKNWGKFMVMRPDVEWQRRALIDDGEYTSSRPLLEQRGWTPEHIWVLDLETGEGAYFRPGGLARADLNKHRIWVCPLYEPFLTWLYRQDLSDLQALPDVVNLPDAPFAMRGYRREGDLEDSFAQLGVSSLAELVTKYDARIAALQQENAELEKKLRRDVP